MQHSLRRKVAAVLREIPIDFGGGCSVNKGYLLAWLIRRYSLKTTVDIGVYRGRSLFPQALSHRCYSGGVVYGVDPWSKDAAKEQDNEALRDKITEFIEKVDLEKIYQEVDSLRNTQQFAEHCRLIRERSADAISYFNQHDIRFDLIHIDGNHDTRIVTQDVELYVPRLQKNGFVVLDDASWDSVKPACNLIASRMPVVYRRLDRANDYMVFWNGESRLHAMMLRCRLRMIGSALGC
jgi:predicted O-methyltransferase YrrM